jgi:hypothetical protein
MREFREINGKSKTFYKRKMNMLINKNSQSKKKASTPFEKVYIKFSKANAIINNIVGQLLQFTCPNLSKLLIHGLKYFGLF